MTRTLGLATFALAGLVLVTPAEAQRGRGGGGAGRGGGISAGGARSFGGGLSSRGGGSFGGLRSGGGGMSFGRSSPSLGGSRPGGLGSSGMRAPSLGSLRSPSIGRGSLGSSFGSGSRSSPSVGSLRSSPGLGGLRISPNLGSPSPSSGLGSLRSSPSPGSLRISPDLRSLSRPSDGRASGPGNAGLGTPGLRNPSVGIPTLGNRSKASISRPAGGNSTSPRIGDGLPARSLNPWATSGLGDRLRGENRPGGGGASPPRELGPAAANRLTPGDGRPGRGSTAAGVARDLGRTDGSPRSGVTSLRPDLGEALGRGRDAGALDRASRATAGRVTPQNLNNFLSLRGSDVNRARLNSFARTDIVNNHFRSLNVTQINRINNNINVGFRHHGHGWAHGHHHGWGYEWRAPYWNNWAFGVRGFWNPGRYYNCFTPRFWATNYCYFPWRRSYYWWGAQPWTYWWSTPTWGNLCNWLPSYGWSDPYYYGYGPGGNIAFSSGYVYLNDAPIATVEEYAASAAELATVPPPAAPDKPTEWMPLGTFVLSQGVDDKNPQRVVQLAVDKDGIVSGTMVNQETKQTYAIQGRVDKETQRVAFTIGDNKDVVFETGIYNLTQQQTPVLAMSDGKEETYLLLRLEEPKADGTPPAAPAGEASATPAPPASAPPAPPRDETIPPPPPAPDESLAPLQNPQRER